MVRQAPQPEAFSLFVFVCGEDYQALSALCKRILNAMHNTQVVATLQAHDHQINQPTLPLTELAGRVILHIVVLFDQLPDASPR